MRGSRRFVREEEAHRNFGPRFFAFSRELAIRRKAASGAPSSGHNETNRADFSPHRPVVVAAPESPPSRASHATREGPKARSAEAFASFRKRVARVTFRGTARSAGEARAASSPSV